MSWHPSGKFLAFRQFNPQTKWDTMILPLDGNEKSGWKPGQPTKFLATPFNEADPEFSPDGRWIAYQSDESGKFEIYVQPFPGPGGRWQISTGGGEYATWSKATKELFYRTADQDIMVARYTTAGDSFIAEKPTSWSSASFTDRGIQTRNFDLHPDGKRFVVVKSSMPNEKYDRVVLMLNFFDELRRVIH
jgi:eukaryotic-like serine/threonine-protein kinase